MRNKPTLLTVGLALSFLFLTSYIHGQGFERVYPMPGSQTGLLIRATNNYPVIVYSDDFGPNFITTRITQNGTLVNKVSAPSNEPYPKLLEFTSDNGFIVATRLEITTNDHDLQLAKYDSTGNRPWNVTVSDTFDELPNGFTEAIDKSIYVISTLWRTNVDRLFKFDSTGNVLWTRDYSNLGNPLGILPTADGGCMLSFAIGGLPPTDKLIKVDQTGSIEWQKQGNNLGNSNTIGFPGSFIQASDGGYAILIGTSEANRQEAILNKFDSIGNFEWSYILSAPDSIQYYAPSNALKETSDGGFVFSGTHGTRQGSWNGFFAKVSSSGDSLWYRQLNEKTGIMDLTEDNKGYLYATGNLYVSLIETHLWVLKTDSLGRYSDNSISGTVFSDNNFSCGIDSSEITLSKWLLKAEGKLATHYATSNLSGNYFMQAQIDSYSLDIYPKSPYWEPCINHDTVIINSTSFQDTINAGVKPIVLCPWLDVSICGSRIRPGGFMSEPVQYCNYGTVSATNVYIVVKLPPEISVSSASKPYTQNGQTLTFSIGILDVGECDQLMIRGIVDTGVMLGDLLCTSAHIFPDSICRPGYNGDNPATDITCSVVVGSFDPNEKLGYPFGEGQEHYINADTQLNYIIYFQNTGTDTAFRIIVIDTLPDQLDVKTFKPGAASHLYDYEIYGEGIVKFTFDPIALPDSNTNEPESKGFVKYSINQQPGLSVGTQIINRAAIYFDFNAPVITEPWIYTTGGYTFIAKQTTNFTYVEITPNPARDFVSIDGHQLPSNATLMLYDVFGKTVQISSLSVGTTNQLNVNGLHPGYYIYQIISLGNITQTGKIVLL